MKKYSKKGLEKRKAERECLPEFFKKHIEIAKTKCCANCGEKLKGEVSEIAHRLPKSFFKSIMCDDENVVYLRERPNSIISRTRPKCSFKLVASTTHKNAS